MSVKRPRIPAELSDRIDQARGLVPFEAYVRDALERQLADDWETTLGNLVETVDRRQLLHFLLMEAYGWHWPAIQPDLDAEHAAWVETVDEIAVEQEHEEP